MSYTGQLVRLSGDSPKRGRTDNSAPMVVRCPVSGPSEPPSLPRVEASERETVQTVPMSADLVEAISDALADALVTEYLECLGNLTNTVDSPRGMNHPEEPAA
jgi:hypothetical protein